MAFYKALSYIQRKISDVEVVHRPRPVESVSIPKVEYGAALGAEMINLVVDASNNLPPKENVHVRMKFDPVTGEMVTCEVEHLNILEASRGFTQADAPAATFSSPPSPPATVFSHSLSLEQLKESAIARLPPVAPTAPLSPANFRVFKVLGSGGMGTVALVAHQDTRQYFALKVIKKEDLLEYEYALVFTEQDAMRRLVDSPWFVQLKASFQDEDNFYFLTEFCSKGSLDKKIYKSKLNRLSETDARRYIAQLILAVEDLHFCKILHRDLKPANVLLNAHDQVQLADFGLARQFGATHSWRSDPRWIPRDRFGLLRSEEFHHGEVQKDYTLSAGGTWGYMSPEAIRRQPVSYPADVWGIGTCLYEMLYGTLPFGIKDDTSKAQMSVLTLSMPLEFDKDVPVHVFAKDLLHQLLDKDPSTRITIERIKAHPWFISVDWDAVTYECAKKQTVHWYARKGDEPGSSACKVEFGTPYATVDDVPYPWFQWTQPGPLTSPMSHPGSSKTSGPVHAAVPAPSSSTDVEPAHAGNSTSRTCGVGNGPSVSVICEGSSTTLAPNADDVKTSGSRTSAKLKVKQWWTRRTGNLRVPKSAFSSRRSQGREKERAA